MKKLTLKKMLFTAAMLIAAGQAAVAAAHDLNDNLGAAASAVDYWQVVCGPTTDHLFLQIDDVGVVDGRQLFIVGQKGNVAASATAPDGGISPSIAPVGGIGVYNVFIGKTAAGPAIYHLTYHCQNADSSVHTLTSGGFKQNQ